MPTRLLLFLSMALLVDAARPGAFTSQPNRAWLAYVDATDAGFSTARLDEARAHAVASQSAAVMVVYRGQAVAAWGDVQRPFMAHSIRKSLAGALYGLVIRDGRVSLSSSLADLGVHDEPALTDEERRATFGDLIASRSGVYHGAAYADGQQESQRPARGSHRPGTFFFYNNWDFNAAEAVYERVTGENLFAAFERRIARPLGMEDFSLDRQLEVLEPSQSRHPAHAFRMSTRDLARFGQLYLQEGRWGDRQIVPADWVRDSLRPHSTTGDRTGYGYLWWIYDRGSLGEAYPQLNRLTVYLARGTGGQALFVIPEAEIVVAHRGDTDNGRPVGGPAIWQLVERIVAARTGEPVARPGLGPLRVEPLPSVLPAPPEPRIVALDAAARRRVAGDYEIRPGAIARVFEYDERLFTTVPGLGEAELFATGPLTFTVKVQPGVVVEFHTPADGAATGVTLTVGRQTIRAARRGRT